MTSYGATALLLLAITTGCLAAQSDRSRQRSGPIRSVPVAADIKRDNDFDCPEEFGYYSHPTDCTLYYVCVFGGALLESCTGGLMYSHELQTCDWPRNVGCDATGPIGNDDLERLNERDHRPPPPPPPPRRTPPPPPPQRPQPQPNPIVTSRGQPKFNRDEYEKQQQLYAEVDDLPPVEEIESDRQQRVYRGQPSTIGQVQKDRDGYINQVVSSGRTLNSNIIPASIPQNSGKIGSFSFGTQVDDRRTATVTPTPHSYSDTKSDESLDTDRLETNEIDLFDISNKHNSRSKRDVSTEYTTEIVATDSITESNFTVSNSDTADSDNLTKRSDGNDEIEYYEFETESTPDDEEELPGGEDSERGKRQVRYFLKNGFKTPGKTWASSKPIKFVDLAQLNYNANNANRFQQNFNVINNNNNNAYEVTRKPYSDNGLSTTNQFSSIQYDGSQSQRPFKASLPDPFSRFVHNPMNTATHIITKSPPISSLKNNENPFSALAGGFYNNVQNNQFSSQIVSNKHLNNQGTQDYSHHPSTIVTGKPLPVPTSAQFQNNLRYNNNVYNNKNNKNYTLTNYQKPQQVKIIQQTNNRPQNSQVYAGDDDDDDDDDNSSDEESSENNEGENESHGFPDPPYEFTHPSNKFANIENPFANPNFNFDEFLAKLRDDHYSVVGITTPRPKLNVNIVKPSGNSGGKSTTLSYKGMSTPRPFSSPTVPAITPSILNNVDQFGQQGHRFPANHQPINHQHNYSPAQKPQVSAATPLEAVRPKLKPPNFKDERQLPINFKFDRPIDINVKSQNNQTQIKGEAQQIFSISQRPFVFLTSTGSPVILSTPKQKYIYKPDKIYSVQPHLVSTGSPYHVSSGNPLNGFNTVKVSTQRPSPVHEQLSILQQFWKNLSTEPNKHQSSPRPNSVSELPKLENLFVNTLRPLGQFPPKNHNFQNVAKEPTVTTTTKRPPKRRPIPKPSPEMSDYYYDDDEQYYEPPVKPKYMPSSEVRPQRPPMAQNDQEYDDNYEEETTPKRPYTRYPSKYNNYKVESVTKNHNDVSVVTKVPLKDANKNGKGPANIDSSSAVLMRPEISDYRIVHHTPRNKTFIHLRKPLPSESGPYTPKPPKYLNQTTLRPYTVRHRLAKPTTMKITTIQQQSEDAKQTRGRLRHQNIVAKMKVTTPRDSNRQESRLTKSKHDDKTNSLEPTENVTPSSYSASPRPKMLYNGSQNYAPEQFDPYYAVYDEDGELYKDTDYVQQYNTASLRPAVQQTYRGTPPPARRPIDSYTPSPSPDDYDDALIQGQINNQNQYQTPIRHSTRGEGNELGYDHIPSSVRTTLFEATSISTTPSTTTSTSTTTQRPTIAPYTEAITPSRYSPRSSTDKSSKLNPEDSLNQNSTDESSSDIPSTPKTVTINFSSLAKPFEKTDNLYRLKETLSSTETSLTTPKSSARGTNNYQNSVEVVRSTSNDKNNNKVVSLTSGFSIRRNLNNTFNPYTLTVLTRPFEDYDRSKQSQVSKTNEKDTSTIERYYYNHEKENNSTPEKTKDNTETEDNISSDVSMRRKDASQEISREVDDDIPIYTRPTKTRVKSISTEYKTTPKPTVGTTKYFLKTVIKRPAPFSFNNESNDISTENNLDTNVLIESAYQNTRENSLNLQRTNLNQESSNSKRTFVEPYKTLDNLRNNHYKKNTDRFVPTLPPRTTTHKVKQHIRTEKSTSKPLYYSYKVEDEIPDQTTEVFGGAVKNVIKAFFQNFASTTKPVTTSPSPKIQETKEEVVNIGFQNKPYKYLNADPIRNNVKHLQIVTEPALNKFTDPGLDNYNKRNREPNNYFSSTTSSTFSTSPYFTVTTPIVPERSTFVESSKAEPTPSLFESKFSSLLSTTPESESSHKFKNIIADERTVPQNNKDSQDSNNINTSTRQTDIESTKMTEFERQKPKLVNEIATTTSTTKSTTEKFEPTLPTKSVSFPTRASRVNPAIKLAATVPGGGRRSYQSTSKCASDNSLQANPKCNEIKYQRPSSTRGRGSAHYSTSGSEAPQQQQTLNRGTPPTRSRPTLKPSTSIVSKSTEFVDIYTNPPSRPAPVYPQPTPDKTAAKCRKDVCLLPDCNCGGKDIPADLPMESVPQIVLLTFDDSVNDLNKGLYTDLFEKGRVNPNGCPISATFYVSHEWTDYSQVQNLYAAGHEMASHTVSHSFGEQFSQKKWNREVGGQREILSAYGGVKLEDVRGMRAPFLSVGGNKMFKMLYDSNFTYDSSLPVYENRPPSWPYTLDYKLFHDCMIPPCPTKSYPGVWEVPMVMWQDLNGGRCSMGDACANPSDAEGVYKMILKNFDRHYTTNRAPFGLYYHAAYFTQPHHKEGFIMFLDFINRMKDVWIVTNWQALQWVRDPTPISRLNNFQPFQCDYQDRPKKCNNPKVCNLWHKSGVRYMRTCQPCPEIYPWTGKTGIRSSRIDNEIDE